jgi:tight adherence protein B
MVEQIPLLVFGAVFALVLSVWLVRVAKRQAFQAQLRRRLGEAGLQQSILKSDEDEGSSLAKLIVESGLGWTMGQFWTRLVLASIFGFAVGLIVGGFAGGLGLAVVGGVVFPALAYRAREQRLALCDEQMPQALEVMALALRAGHPLPSALAIAAGEAPQPIADELRRACDEHDLGRPIADVISGIGKRLPTSESVQTFVVAVLVLQQTGGNLISVIDRIIENARARAQYRAKLRALTSEGRSSAKMLALMPLAFGILAAVVDPTYASTLISTPGGNVVLASSLALWGFGVVWTRRLVREEA